MTAKWAEEMAREIVQKWVDDIRIEVSVCSCHCHEPSKPNEGVLAEKIAAALEEAEARGREVEKTECWERIKLAVGRAREESRDAGLEEAAIQFEQFQGADLRDAARRLRALKSGAAKEGE